MADDFTPKGTLTFTKMQGLGNDFVIIDERTQEIPVLTPYDIQNLANRRTGVGCDQVIMLSPSTTGDVYMTIYNADGSLADACGNGTRCVVSHLNQQECLIETAAGMLHGWLRPDKKIVVDMGKVKLDPEMVDLEITGLEPAMIVNVGNPHAVFFVDDVKGVDLEIVGPQVETHSHFPNKTNVEFAQIISSRRIRMRVWERGVGITPACGSGACAVGVAAVAAKLVSPGNIEVELDGGILLISWESNGHVLQTGPAVISFKGNYPVK